MNHFAFRSLAAAAASIAVATMLASCGSGGVSAPPTVATGAISVTPSAATVYSGLPSTFVITGGNGTYNVISNNQAVVPTMAVTGNAFTVLPREVAADTPVSITVQDAASSQSTTALLTVKARTISNVITITPSAGQASACGTAICSGGDAELKVVVSQAGVALGSRTIRFDVVSGDLRFIVPDGSSIETLATSVVTTTDSTGAARVRVRVLSNAGTQTAIVSATDIVSGFVQTASVPIAQSSASPLTVTPSSIQFTGATTNTCATGVSAEIIIVGGRPPYQLTQPSGFTVFPALVTSNPGRATITANGQCARNPSTGVPDGGQTLTVLDGLGSIATVTIHNDPAPVSGQTSPFDVSPTAVTLSSCTEFAEVALVGGTKSYYAVSGNSSVQATVLSSTRGRIQRTPGSAGTAASPVTVTFSDGQSNKTVAVTLAGAGATANCPP